jgi:hypothetical protein
MVFTHEHAVGPFSGLSSIYLLLYKITKGPFIQILSRFYPNFIQIKPGYNLDEVSFKKIWTKG